MASKANLPESFPGLFTLPHALSDHDQVVQDLSAQSAEADLLLVAFRSQPEQRAVVKLYHTGIQPKREVLQWINAEAPRHVVQLLEYGQSADTNHEVLECIEQGSLRE